MRRVGIVVAAVVVLLAGTTAAAEPARPQLRITGLGGQAAVLTVPAGGLRVDYPFFDTPRLPGPDGTVGGVLIQDLRTREAAGGVVLQNVPGFDVAIALGLVEFEGVTLRPGRYALTLLGEGRQSVALSLRARKGISLAARGPARPITRSRFGSGRAAHAWSDPVQVPAARSIVLLGQGAGGDLQQASVEQACFRRAPVADACLAADSTGASAAPGATASGSWLTLFYELDPADAGAYSHTGRVVGAGLGTAAHTGVLITLPR